MQITTFGREWNDIGWRYWSDVLGNEDLSGHRYSSLSIKVMAAGFIHMVYHRHDVTTSLLQKIKDAGVIFQPFVLIDDIFYFTSEDDAVQFKLMLSHE